MIYVDGLSVVLVCQQFYYLGVIDELYYVLVDPIHTLMRELQTCKPTLSPVENTRKSSMQSANVISEKHLDTM